MRHRILLAIWLLLAFASSSAAQPAARRILILKSFETEFAPDNNFAQILRAELSRQSPVPVEFFEVSLQPAPTVDVLQEGPVLDYLRSSLAGQRLDLVVTLSGPAAVFARTHRPEIFPDTPLLFAAVDSRWVQEETLAPTETAVAVSIDLPLVVGEILRVLPRTSTVFIVVGNSKLEQFWRNELTRTLAPLASRLNFVYFNDLSFTEMLKRSASLPPNSAIFYALLSVDASGFSYTEQRSLAGLYEIANAPIFGLYTTQLGRGIVGGPLFVMDALGRDTAAAALRIMDGESPGSLKTPVNSYIQPVYDWRELRRWGIAESRLPPGSVVQFRQQSAWDLYKGYIIGIACFLFLETALLAGLVVQNRRRRRAEIALRQSHAQNRDLAGRLIDAQEQERTRIARDLHDDVSQQLAGLGIMLSSLKRKFINSGVGPEVDQAVKPLQDRTSTLAQTIRNLSHELHPSVLQHAGLVATLRRHCAEVGEHHRLTVTFSAADDLDGLGAETALCLFRVAQEALTNVVRHAHARTVLVQLAAVSDGVELRVVDDGIGFDVRERSGQGLGLRSVDERVRLVCGHASVDSRHGEGTTLRVYAPVTPVAALAFDA